MTIHVVNFLEMIDVKHDESEGFVPAGGAVLEFQHVYGMESRYDGCVLEGSFDGGAFQDLGARIITGGYTGTIATGWSNPLAGRQAWTGTGGPTRVTVDLSPYGGSSVVIRFRLGCDSMIGGDGWYVDDVMITSAGTGTGVDEGVALVPTEFALFQNSPNPFNPVTSIDYALARDCVVRLTIFNYLGQQVLGLIEGRQAAGIHTATWNAEGLPSGVYFYRLEAADYSETKKMLLVR